MHTVQGNCTININCTYHNDEKVCESEKVSVSEEVKREEKNIRDINRMEKKMQSMDNLRNMEGAKYSSRTSEHDSCWVQKTAHNEGCNSSCNWNSHNCCEAGRNVTNNCCRCCCENKWTCNGYDMEARIRYLQELEKMAAMMNK